MNTVIPDSHQLIRANCDVATRDMELHFRGKDGESVIIRLSETHARTLQHSLSTALDVDWIAASHKEP